MRLQMSAFMSCWRQLWREAARVPNNISWIDLLKAGPKTRVWPQVTVDLGVNPSIRRGGNGTGGEESHKECVLKPVTNMGSLSQPSGAFLGVRRELISESYSPQYLHASTPTQLIRELPLGTSALRALPACSVRGPNTFLRPGTHTKGVHVLVITFCLSRWRLGKERWGIHSIC